jgi:hypothetical protein
VLGVTAVCVPLVERGVVARRELSTAQLNAARNTEEKHNRTRKYSSEQTSFCQLLQY